MKPFDPRLIKQVPQTRVPVALLGVLGGLSGVAAIAGAFGIAWLMTAVVDGESIARPGLFVVGVFALRGLLTFTSEQVASWAATRISGALRLQYLRRSVRAGADERPDSATLHTVATTGADSVEPYVARYLPALVAAATVPPLAIIALVVVDLRSAFVVVMTLPLLPIFAALIGQHTQEATQRRWATETRLAGHFLDVMRGLPTLVNFGRAKHQSQQVEQVGDKHRVATVQTLKIAFLSSAALELLATISVAIVAVWSGIRLAHGDLGLQVALTAILIAPEAYWPVRRVGQEFHSAADGVEAIDALLPPVDADVPAEHEPARTLAVHDLDYTYPGTSQPVITGLSATIGSGLTAVTGPSGVGKTTLLELLAGLREPTSGAVERPRTHLITQTPFIAPMSVRDNLLLGHLVPDAAQQLPEAMRATGLDAVVESLPDGLDTLLGDNGFGLSAGQRARLVLTRAWLSDADVVLMDEPSAHLDPDAAAQVRDVVVRLAAQRPVVIVTHDDALAAAADHTLPLTHPVVTR